MVKCGKHNFYSILLTRNAVSLLTKTPKNLKKVHFVHSKTLFLYTLFSDVYGVYFEMLVNFPLRAFLKGWKQETYIFLEGTLKVKILSEFFETCVSARGSKKSVQPVG